MFDTIDLCDRRRRFDENPCDVFCISFLYPRDGVYSLSAWPQRPSLSNGRKFHEEQQPVIDRVSEMQRIKSYGVNDLANS